MKNGDVVTIPTSELSKVYGPGTVVEMFGESAKVVFTNKETGESIIGIYTISKHTFEFYKG